MGLFVSVLFVLIALLFKRKMVFIIVNQHEVVFLERFGKLKTELSPGIHFYLPFVETPRYLKWSSNEEIRRGREQPVVKNIVRVFCHIPVGVDRVFDFPEIEVISKDKLSIFINGVLIYRIVDAKKAAYEVEDLTRSLELLLQTYMRDIASKISLDAAIEGRSNFQHEVKTKLSSLEDRWGIKVVNIDIQSIDCDERIRDANTELAAERRKAEATNQKVCAEREAELNRLETERLKKEAENRINRERKEAEYEIKRSDTILAIDLEKSQNEFKRLQELAVSKHESEIHLLKRKAEMQALICEEEAFSKKRRMEIDDEQYRQQCRVKAEKDHLMAQAAGREAMLKAEFDAGLTEKYYIARESTKSFSRLTQNAKLVVPMDVSKYMGGAVLQKALQDNFLPSD